MAKAVSEARLSRARFGEVASDIQSAVLALDKAVGASGLEECLLELVRLRASQVNGCAFCVQYHLIAARRMGLSSQKLDLLVVWHEAQIFSDRERAALGWTEALTEIAGMGVSDDDWDDVRDVFSEREVAALTACIGAVNVWNRIAIAFRYDPPGPVAA